MAQPMAGMLSLINPAVHDAAAMRRAGPDLLSLALMDARSRTLGWLSAFEGLHWPEPIAGFDPPIWRAGQAGWFQEYWIARHVQRDRGDAADAAAPRLASMHPQSDAWFSPLASRRRSRWAMDLPDADGLRQYLADTLDATLDLLARLAQAPALGEGGAGDDTALHVFRLALHHEDRLAESLATQAQAFDLSPERWAPLVAAGLWHEPASRLRREPLRLGAQTLMLGTPPGGWVPPAERFAHEVWVDEFEIDAQPVSWAQFTEFVADGGYDDRQHWTDAGWAWLLDSHRRAPRYVQQLGRGVLARRQGRLVRLAGPQSVLHVNAHEARAWCRWAGRRLPTEAEWELAARHAGARGFAWGEQLEWVTDRAQAYPGAAAATPDADLNVADRVLRGASQQASGRLRHPAARRFVSALRDDLFCGLRSCAL